MAINIIRDPSRTSMFATGLGTGLQELAAAKTKNLISRQMQEKTAAGLQALPGVTPEMAQQLSGLQPEILQPVVKSLVGQTGAKRDIAESQKQLNIVKHNKPFLTKLGDLSQNTGKMMELADSMYEDVLTGQVASGWGGTIKGAVGPAALNDASQRFLTASNNLAEMIVRGVPTGFKLKFAQEMKPNLKQSTEVQKSELRRVMKQAAKGQLYDAITNQIITENGGMQPLNMQTEVQKRFNVIHKKMDELPDATNEPDGTVALDEQSGLQFVVKNGTWRPEF